jgi:hypothetical protein
MRVKEMWKMPSLLALATMLLTGAHAQAGQRTPFSTHFQAADTVLVGVVESVRPIQPSEPRATLALVIEHAPEDTFPLYPCELGVRVRATIKAKNPLVEAGSLVPIIWYLLSPTCAADYRGDTLLGKPALWLLRTENGFLRALVDGSGTDNTPSVLPMQSFSPDTERKLAEWKDPRLAVTYLILKPGVIIPEDRYAISWLPGDVAAVAGYFNFLKVYRAVYLESDARVHGLISIEVAASGECLEAARSAIVTEQQHGEVVPHHSLLDRDVERRTAEVDDFGWMGWATKEQLLQDLGGSKEAIDGLTTLACGTDPRVKARAGLGTVAWASVNGPQVWINPFRANPGDSQADSALVAHETLHNLGLTDTVIQQDLGIAVTPITLNISNKLQHDCFPGGPA